MDRTKHNSERRTGEAYWDHEELTSVTNKTFFMTWLQSMVDGWKNQRKQVTNFHHFLLKKKQVSVNHGIKNTHSSFRSPIDFLATNFAYANTLTEVSLALWAVQQWRLKHPTQEKLHKGWLHSPPSDSQFQELSLPAMSSGCSRKQAL